MKKLLLITALACGLGLTTQAQTSPYLLGGGISYGAQTEKVGLNLRAYKQFNKFRAGTELTIFNKHTYVDTATTFKSYQNELMLNFHYLINIKPKLSVYPLAGFNFNLEFLKNTPTTGSESTTINLIGVNNIGAGIQYQLSPKALLFSEFRHATSEYNRNIGTIGFMLNSSTKN